MRSPARKARGAPAWAPILTLRLAAALALWLTAGLAPRSADAAAARVQYVSAASVYLDAGRAAGLVEGATVTVSRAGQEIARLSVVFVAEHSTACRVISSTDAVRVGDTATYSPAATEDSSATEATRAAGSTPPTVGSISDSARAAMGSLWPRVGHVHGRIASLYTKTSDPAGTYENPSVFGDIRWAGRGLEQATLRARATRPTINGVSDLPGSQLRESALRVYEVTAGYRSRGGALEAEAGRILPRRVEGVGTTDGASVFWRFRPTVGIGFAGGRSADLAIAGLPSQGLELGAVIDAGSRAGFAQRRWHVKIGAAFSRDSSLTRRSFVVERADYGVGAGTSFHQSVEVDLNPGWKRDLGEPGTALTAWSFGGNLWMDRRVSFTLSADSRRAVLYPVQRLATSPVTLDRLTGVHASSRIGLPRECAVRVGADIRRRERDGEIMSSWDAAFTSSRFGMKGLSGGLHAMGYDAEHLSGWNGDANLTARLGSSSQLDLAGGLGGTTTDLEATVAPSYRSRWLRAGIDYRSPGGLWATLAHEWRGGGPGNELAAELGVSF